MGGLPLYLVLGGSTMLGVAATDLLFPGFPAMADDLGVSASAVQVTLSTFLVGLAAGQLVAGPLSDARGRRRPLIAGILLFTVSSLACAAAPSLAVLAAMRLLQGMGASAGVVIGRAVVGDLFAGSAAARYLSRLVIVVGLAPILAPLLGSLVLRSSSWRGVFVALALLGGALLLAVVSLLPETLPRERRGASGLRPMVGSMRVLGRERMTVQLALVLGLASAAMVVNGAGAAFALQDVYGASPELYAAIVGLCAVAMVVGAQVNGHLAPRLGPGLLLRGGLTGMVVAGIAAFTVVLSPLAGVAALVPALALLLWSWGFVQANLLALAMEHHPSRTGAAAGLMGLVQYAFGAAAAPVGGIGGGSSALPMATGVLVLAALGWAMAWTLPSSGPVPASQPGTA